MTCLPHLRVPAQPAALPVPEDHRRDEDRSRGRPGHHRADDRGEPHQLDVPRDQGEQPGGRRPRAAELGLELPGRLRQRLERGLVLHRRDARRPQRHPQRAVPQGAVDPPLHAHAQSGLHRREHLPREEQHRGQHERAHQRRSTPPTPCRRRPPRAPGRPPRTWPARTRPAGGRAPRRGPAARRPGRRPRSGAGARCPAEGSTPRGTRTGHRTSSSNNSARHEQAGDDETHRPADGISGPVETGGPFSDDLVGRRPRRHPRERRVPVDGHLVGRIRLDVVEIALLRRAPMR